MTATKRPELGVALHLQATAINTVLRQISTLGLVLRRVGYRGDGPSMAVLNLTFEGVPEGATSSLLAHLAAMPTVLSASFV